MRRILLCLSLFACLDVQAQFYGRTQGALPYFNYGLGEDRLGGAKLGYIDSNVLVKVVDSVGAQYKVQLSIQHHAWLPKQQLRRDSGAKATATYLTSSWRVWGDDRYDYVSIGLPERLPYSIVQQIDPARIVVDVYGAVSNTNWITQLKTAKEIKNAWYEQVEDDVFRVYIELKHRQHWGYLASYDKTNLRIRVKQQPSSLHLRHLTIAIDAGHGGSNSGATGVTSNVNEKEYTLKIAKELEAYLKRKHARVFMTRTSDTDLSMVERTLMLRNEEPDLLISVHLNSSGNAQVSGVSTYYRYIGFRPLSLAVLARMLQLGLNNYGNVGSFNFSLSGPTEYPNCLVEVAFLSNTEDERRIIDPRFRKAAAKQIAKGVRDWLRENN
jgi:N-acetylmuramoyl-L-alanine amidase